MDSILGRIQIAGKTETQTIHALRDLISAKWAKEILLVSAYLQTSGLEALQEACEKQKCIKRLIVGINNGVTSHQALTTAIAYQFDVIGVDTGPAIQPAIFHPKFYCARGAKQALVLLGSSNLTVPGLFNNFEATLQLPLDLTNKQDRIFFKSLITPLARLERLHPKHFIHIRTKHQISSLLSQRRLVDETKKKKRGSHHKTSGASGPGPDSGLKLQFHRPTKSARTSAQRTVRKRPATAAPKTIEQLPALTGLLWRKARLSRTDLQLKTSSAPTGVLRLTRSDFKVGNGYINHETYFKRVVFRSCDWKVIAKNNERKQMTQAIFSLVVDGKVKWSGSLDISFKRKWSSKQGNYTTGLHWGDAVPIVQKNRYENRSLSLYATNLRTTFVIVVS